MSTLRSARRLVRESAQPLEFVSGHVISHRLQRAGVKSAGDSIAAVGAAVQKRLEVHCRNGAVFFHPGLYLHQHRMPAAMAIKDFLAGESVLHRTPSDHRQLADGHFMIEGIALASEATAV